MRILQEGSMEILGQLAVASNATLLVSLSEDAQSEEPTLAVYKPIDGEQPLWDFPDGTLALREVSAYLVSEALQWSIVPTTILRDGPYGLGAVQLWIDIDEDVDLIALAQSDDPRLAKIALFDALINNTDRKVSHLLPSGTQIYGCDHGVTFHVEDKLRTVLWQFRGQPIPDDLLTSVERLDVQSLQLPLHEEEIEALNSRKDRLIAAGTFPYPNPQWPAVPWPPV